MSLDESRFAQLATETLDAIAEGVDESLGDVIDVEYDSGIITMTLADGGQYVINKHGPLKQIWMSSPVSGAWHFEWSGESWVGTRNPLVELTSQLVEELRVKTGQVISL